MNGAKLRENFAKQKERDAFLANGFGERQVWKNGVLGEGLKREVLKNKIAWEQSQISTSRAH